MGHLHAAHCVMGSLSSSRHYERGTEADRKQPDDELRWPKPRPFRYCAENEREAEEAQRAAE